MRSAIRIVSSILFLLGSYFYGSHLINLLKLLLIHWKAHKIFITSFLVSSVAFFILLKPGDFLITFEHEFTHMVWGLLFLRKPKIFAVTDREGGIVGYYGSSNFLIALAPYFSLTLNFILIGIYYLLKPDLHRIFFAVFGVALGYHLSSFFKEFSLKQPDIVHSGVVFSIIFLVFVNILAYGIVIAFVIGRGDLTLSFIKLGALDGYHFFISIFSNLVKIFH